MSITSQHLTDCSSQDNARDAAAGKKVKTSKYGHAGGKTTCLDPGMPKFLLAVAAKGKVKVNSMAGSKHGDGSAHYRCVAWLAWKRSSRFSSGAWPQMLESSMENF